MALSRRLSLIQSSSFIFVTCFIASSSIIRASAPPDAVRITAVANVTLRATPSSTAPAVAQLPLGTEVIESGPSGLDKTWVQVRLSDSREGWVQSSLTRPLDPVWRWPAFDRIISERLGRKGDGFPAGVELVAFIERVAPEYTDKDGRARVELARLKALSNTAAVIPLNQSRREPYATWLAARKDQLVYDEPGGRWMLRPDLIWSTHSAHASTAIADDIAWFAVNTGLPGECEGQISCYLSAFNVLQGEYLRRHPAGRRAAESVDLVTQSAERLAPSGKVAPAYAFDRGGCQDMVKAVDGLSAAIKDTRTVARDRALTSLTALKKLCN
jgi:hypothetical protein